MSFAKDVKNVSGLVSEVVLDSLETMSALGFVILDARGVVLKANQMARELLGFSNDVDAAISWESFFMPEDRQAELPRSHQIICSKEGEYHVHASLVSASKEKIDACLVYKSIPNADSEDDSSRGICVFIKDNSYVRGLEKEVHELRKHCPVEANADSSSLRELCHKLRSPLTLISLSVNLLRDYSEKMSPEERAEELQQIEEGLFACEKAVANVTLSPQLRSQPKPTPSAPSSSA